MARVEPAAQEAAELHALQVSDFAGKDTDEFGSDHWARYCAAADTRERM